MGNTSAREEILFGVLHLKGNAGLVPTKFRDLENKIVN